MDLSPVFAELAQPTPSREVVIEELDKVTDCLRGGIPTNEYIDQLFELFNKLIHFNQWHIQQYTLSCTKYIFENSTLTKEQKLNSLLNHTEFTTYMGELFGNAKREVREMSAQCIGQLAIQIGPAILTPKLGITDFVFNPAPTAFAIEGQQMALGRLATAFRIVSQESLLMLINSITNDEALDVLTNASENGYGYWYSTRALYLFVTDELDCTLEKHRKAFLESREYLLPLFGEQILNCAVKRLSHHYANARRAAAKVVASVFKGTKCNETEFIEKLIPVGENLWVQREGHLSAIAECLDAANQPFPADFAEKLAGILLDLAHDEMPNDPNPLTQKGNANSMAAKALVKLLRLHDTEDHSLYEKYVHELVIEFLRSPVAALLDGGVICTAELKKLGYDVTDLLLLTFKDICHSSFPIRDLARRTVNVKDCVDNHFDELLETIFSFADSEDSEIRECVAKSLILVAQNSSVQLPDEVTQCGLSLAQDPVDTVKAAGLDLVRTVLTKESAPVVVELCMMNMTGESEEATIAAIKLLKHAIKKYPDETVGQFSAAPILAFLSLSPMSSPVVSSAAQQLLFLLASVSKEVDEEKLQEFNEIDHESSEYNDYLELVEAANEQPEAAATYFQAVIQNYMNELEEDAIENLPEISLSELNLADKSAAVDQVAYLVHNIAKFDDGERKKILQALADVYADEAIEDKKLLLIALNSVMNEQNIDIPDPTPFSFSHDSETFSKHAN